MTARKQQLNENPERESSKKEWFLQSPEFQTFREKLAQINEKRAEQFDALRDGDELRNFLREVKNEAEKSQKREEYLGLYHELKESLHTQENIEQLRALMNRQYETPHIENDAFASHKIKFIREHEDMPLGENIAKDAIVLLYTFVVELGALLKDTTVMLAEDLVSLPRDIKNLMS